jgi:hypothetical protein
MFREGFLALKGLVRSMPFGRRNYNRGFPEIGVGILLPEKSPLFANDLNLKLIVQGYPFAGGRGRRTGLRLLFSLRVFFFTVRGLAVPHLLILLLCRIPYVI